MRRLRRLWRERSPREALDAARRAFAFRAAQRELRGALASNRRVVVGPFLGEVGYELLYWRPYVLRLLRSHRVSSDRVTILGRGGSGRWYGEFGRSAVDAFELMRPEEVTTHVARIAERRGHRKQTEFADFEHELVSRAGVGDRPAVVHPLQMFWSMRFLWEGLEEPAKAAEYGDYEPVTAERPPNEVARRLPDRYVALKLYFNECVPRSPAAEDVYARIVRTLGSGVPAVALQAGFAADEHEDWPAARVISLQHALRPATNLAVQAAIVARAEALVSTYGGFSYLGPFLGVPTLALGAAGVENSNHERVLRAMLPDARFGRVALGPDAVARAAELVRR